MRASLLTATLGLVLLPLLVHCAATAHDDAPAPAASEPTLPAPPPPPAPPAKDAGTDTSDGAPPPVDCSLAPLTGVPVIAPTFVIASPGVAPPTMTGGTLDGEYVVEKATVYLPSGTAGLVDPKKSTGTIESWAVFKGTRYRLYLKADFTIMSTLGPQSQGVDTESQGGFTATGPVLTLDHACDTAIADEADYSFTDDGSGRATILIKTPTPYGDTYLEMDAMKN